ncbi:beta-lactamase family protein [Terrimonas sp. NA20]|uniref:Beta-lactamase family protein n=1 Tax=Terrimonas ginsenosidimutans TaxID=2908004 RepID=A0ABS9KZ98_9BACT|nr:serine hydrolase domain-containing protein [Terrimonas ginsenosidimutans]MCG2617659.1 beta-lactamase family protein [Terrimonas ginsenosidimutans]
MKVISVALSLLILQPAAAQLDTARLSSELKSRQKLLGNDAVVMIWKDTLIYKKELGDYNTKTSVPVAIASSSKWLTAALVMQFIDEGKLSLDDKVGRWLPEFDRYGKSYITIRNCLSHMTGIDDNANFLKKMFQRTKFQSLEEEVNSFAAREIRANPGNDFWYGQIGVNIAGRVLEVISKKRFDVLIKQKLFTPLGMRKTSFTTVDGGPVNPSGGAFSTPDDYMKFLVMLLNKGQANGKQILSEEAVNTLLQVQTDALKIKYTPKATQGFGYTLGSWAVTEKDGKATVLASPGLFGSWPMIDFCRGYAYLVFTKTLLNEEKAGIHLELKKIVDEGVGGNCQ